MRIEKDFEDFVKFLVAHADAYRITSISVKQSGQNNL